MTTWTIRYSARILKDDLHEVGHAALEVAKKAVDKKLKTDPEGYGTNLHHPLHGLHKIKSSHLRIVYKVKTELSEVWILMIGDRRDIWDSAQEEIISRYEEEVGRDLMRRKAEPRKRRR